MKKGPVLMIALIMISFSQVWAQNPNLEKLNAYKIAFLTKKMNLTSQEAEKFWPLYNEYQDKKFRLQQERVLLNRDFTVTGARMTDKELTDAGDKYIAYEMQEAMLSQELHNKLKGVLPAEKILRLYQAENQYKIQLLNELQNRRQGQALRGNFNNR
jgi:hypothetical protein